MSKRPKPIQPYNPLQEISVDSLTRPIETPSRQNHVQSTELTAPDSRRRRLPTLRVGLPLEKKRTFEMFCHRLGGSLDCSIPPSQMLRVCMELLLAHERHLHEHSHMLRPIARPPNDDAERMRELDNALQALVLRALRT